MNRVKLLGGVVIGLAASGKVLAVDVIPDAASMTTSIAAIGPLAASAAVLGFSIWIYRKVKAKAGQAIG